VQIGEPLLDRPGLGSFVLLLENVDFEYVAPTLFLMKFTDGFVRFRGCGELNVSKAAARLVRVDLELARFDIAESTEFVGDFGLSHVPGDVSDDQIGIWVPIVVSLAIHDQLVALEIDVVHFSETLDQRFLIFEANVAVGILSFLGNGRLHNHSVLDMIASLFEQFFEVKVEESFVRKVTNIKRLAVRLLAGTASARTRCISLSL